MTKKTILYCDDKPSWIEKFTERHSNEFNIVTFTSGNEFLDELRKLSKHRKKPDLILIDFFHPRYDDQHDQAEKEEAEIKGNAAIAELEKTVVATRDIIDKAWKPFGLTMLEEARELFPDLPIVIYTQQGLSVVENEELKRVATLQGEWLLKGRHKFYESTTLNYMLNRAKHIKNIKNLSLAFTACMIVYSFFPLLSGSGFSLFVILGILLSFFSGFITCYTWNVSKIARKK